MVDRVKNVETVCAVSIYIHSGWEHFLSSEMVMVPFGWKFFTYLMSCQTMLTEYKLILSINFLLFIIAEQIFIYGT